MTDRSFQGRGARYAIASTAAVLMASAALAGCEQRAYPQPSAAEPPPAPATAPELMGAPEGRDGRPLPPPEQYGPAPPYGAPPSEQPSAAPPPGYPPAPGEPAYPPPPPRPPEVIAMQPIPNPPDVERGPSHGHRHGRYGPPQGAEPYAPAPRRQAPPYARAEGVVPPNPAEVIAGTPVPNPPEAPPRARPHQEHAPVASRPRAARHYHHPHHPRVHLHAGPVAPAHPTPHPKPAKPTQVPVVVHPTTKTAPAHKAAVRPAAPVHSAGPKPVAPAHGAASPLITPPHGKATTQPHKVTPAPTATVKPPVSAKPDAAKPPLTPVLKTPTSPPVATKGKHGGKAHAPSGDATQLLALSTALTPVVGARATLSGADSLRNGAPGDVSLTVPQDFADGLRAEAAKAGLADAAASAALTAKLSGEGFAVSPADPITQPLMAGQANTFKWTVTRLDAARGPLRADVGADLLGGGKRHVDLGGVSAAAASEASKPRFSPQALGVGILALVVVLIAFIMAGGRRPEGRFGRK